MKKTQVNSVAIVFLAMAILSSCVREVALDAGERPQVVVECVLTNDETQELRLNFTKGASKAEAEPLTEAVATLIDLTEGKTGRVCQKYRRPVDPGLFICSRSWISYRNTGSRI